MVAVSAYATLDQFVMGRLDSDALPPVSLEKGLAVMTPTREARYRLRLVGEELARSRLIHCCYLPSWKHI